VGLDWSWGFTSTTCRRSMSSLLNAGGQEHGRRYHSGHAFLELAYGTSATPVTVVSPGVLDAAILDGLGRTLNFARLDRPVATSA